MSVRRLRIKLPGPWVRHAGCTGHLDAMYPDVPAGHQGGPDPYAAARRLCATCPVYHSCLNYYIERAIPHESHGFRAGMNPNELREARTALAGYRAMRAMLGLPAPQPFHAVTDHHPSPGRVLSDRHGQTEQVA